MLNNKSRNLYPVLLLTIALLIFSSGVSGHRVAGKSSSSSTDAELEREVAALMKQASGQRRSSLTYNPILARIARERAYDMGERNYFGHVNPDGIGPNYLVTQAGYLLPDFYGKTRDANNIESIARGYKTPAEAWDSWMNSTDHRTHLLGLTKFYAEQTEYGVGHAFVPGNRSGHYWVVISAKRGESGSSTASGGTNSPTRRGRAASRSRYPNVIYGANGKLRPASGYVWVDEDDPEDFRVKLMPGLIRTEAGKLRPAAGYRWVDEDDPEDFRVEPIP